MGEISPKILPNVGPNGILPVVGRFFANKVGHVFAHMAKSFPQQMGQFDYPASGHYQLIKRWSIFYETLGDYLHQLLITF